MKSFNVMYDKWIPVELLTGEKITLSLHETVEKMPLIKKISYPGYPKINEFAIYKFLFLFLQNIFRPDSEDIPDMYEEGCLDISKIDTYIEDFEKKGFSFDLYGDTPFMQAWPDDISEKDSSKVAPISVLNGLLLTGTNPIFFMAPRRNNRKDKVEDMYEMTDAELCINLLGAILFPLFTGAGYVASATGGSGCTPVCALYSGRNLFETFMLNMADMSKEEYRNTVPYWENKSRIPDLTTLKESYINYAVIPSAKFRLFEIDGKTKVLKAICEYPKNAKPEIFKEYLTRYDPNLLTIETKKSVKSEDGKSESTSTYVPLTAHDTQRPEYRGTFKCLAYLDPMRYIAGGQKQLITSRIQELGLKNGKISVTFYAQGIKTTSNDYADIYETFDNIDPEFLSVRAQERAKIIVSHINRVMEKLKEVTQGYVQEATLHKSDKAMIKKSTHTFCTGFLNDIYQDFINIYVKRIESDEDIKAIIQDIDKSCYKKFKQFPVIAQDYITFGNWSNILFYETNKLTKTEEVNKDN